MDNVKKLLIDARTEANTLINETLRTLPEQGDGNRGAEYKRLKKLSGAVEQIDNALLSLSGLA